MNGMLAATTFLPPTPICTPEDRGEVAGDEREHARSHEGEEARDERERELRLHGYLSVVAGELFVEPALELGIHG